MKKMNFLLSQLYLLALLALPLVAVSCSDEDDSTSGTTPLNMEITSLGIEDNATVYTGQTIQLEATVNNLPEKASYAWQVDGKEVSTEKNLTFTPSKEGDCKIALTVTSLDKSAKKSINIKVKMYVSTLYIINEGQYGKNGSINKYTTQGVWQNKIGPSLGGTTTTGVVHKGYMYVVSKDTPFLVKIKMADYTEAGKIEKGTSNVLGNNGQGNSFCIVNDETGILTTSNGAFRVNLSSMTLGDKLSNMEDVRSDKENICKAGNYVFILANSIIKVYNASDLSFKQDITNTVKTGFAQSKDGSLWAANENKLVKINVNTLASEEIELPDNLKVYYNSFAFSPTGLQASTTENALYFASKVEEGYSVYGKDIYKYTIESKKAAKFFSAPASDKSVYGSGVQVDPKNGDVYLIYTEDGWGTHYLNTNIYVANGVSGTQKKLIDYSGEYWFPSMIVFE